MEAEKDAYNPVAVNDGFSTDLGESLMTDGLSVHQKAQMRLWRPPKWASALVLGMCVMIVLTFCLAVPGLRTSTTTSHQVLGLRSKQDKQSSTVTSLQQKVDKLEQDLSNLQALQGVTDGLRADVNTLQTSTAGTRTDLNTLTQAHNVLLAQVNGDETALNELDTTMHCNEFAGVLPGGAVMGPLSTNGHYYQLVEITYHVDRDYTTGINWNEAQKDAASRCHNGMRGYLATISSQEEQDYIDAMIPPQDLDFQFYECWIGGTDVHQEGQWMWMDGPEKGTFFWSGGSDGQPIDGHFSNWYCEDATSYPAWPYCEPNDANSGQDCMHVYGNGKWNDVTCDLRANAFLVEFGAPVPSPTPRPGF